MLFLNTSINCYYSYNIFAVILKLFNFNLVHIQQLNFHCALKDYIEASEDSEILDCHWSCMSWY